MAKIIKGRMINKTPMVRAGIKHGKLVIGKGPYFITVDSGFNGDLSVPSVVLDQLDVEYAGTMNFQLADGSIVEKDLWYGDVIIGKLIVDVLMIEGDFLLGMELAEDIFSSFLIDFDNKIVALELRE